jgi:hypothetical protein
MLEARSTQRVRIGDGLDLTEAWKGSDCLGCQADRIVSTVWVAENGPLTLVHKEGQAPS